MTGATPGRNADPAPAADHGCDGPPGGASGGLALLNWRRAGAPGGDSQRYDLRMERGVIRACSPRGASRGDDAPRTPADLGVVIAPGDRVLDLDGAYLTPGLVDAHVHLGIGRPAFGAEDRPGGGAEGASGADGPAPSAEACPGLDENLRSTLAAGVTAVRNLGNVFDLAAQRRMATASTGAGLVAAPRVVTAGRALTRRDRYGGFLGRGIHSGAEGPRAVTEEVDAGATVIKLILTGSVDFATGRVGDPHFEAADVRAMVAAAHSLGATVAAHANGPAAIRLAVEAGVDSVEHGILMDDRALALMAERGTRWVPTLTPLSLLQSAERWPGLPALFAAHVDTVVRGRDLGVAIVAGTDSGSPGVAHNSIATELRLLARAGLSPEEVAATTTSRAAPLLGLPEGYGTLAPGARTDLAWFACDPFVGSGGRDPSGASAIAALGWVRDGRLSVGAGGFNLL